VEVFREAAHAMPLYDAAAPEAPRYLAVVTDRAAEDGDALFAGVPTVLRFGDDRWLDQLATLVEREVMGVGA
jgi:hypothetical protein